MNDQIAHALASYARQQRQLSMPPFYFAVGSPARTLISGGRTTAKPPAPTVVTPVTKSAKAAIPIKVPSVTTAKPAPSAAPLRLAKLHTVPVTSSAQEHRTAQQPDDRRERLAKLLYANRECSQCGLSATRSKYVFGSGSATAPLIVIGDAPGIDENLAGLPFVGEAGQLLTKMLAAINIDRQKDAFLTDVLKCMPQDMLPNDRAPHATEIAACTAVLLQQIEIIAPHVILLMGRVAAHALINTTDTIENLRGKTFTVGGVSTIVTYHPAALLKNAGFKRPALEDLRRVATLLAQRGSHADS